LKIYSKSEFGKNVPKMWHYPTFLALINFMYLFW
jgi:hypothetical protein